MGRISNTDKYAIIGAPTIEDYVIGTDKDNSKKTKNFLLGSIWELFNNIESDTTPLNYRWSDGTDLDIDYNTQGYFFTDDDEDNPSAVTQLIFNKFNVVGEDLTVFFTVINDNKDKLKLKIGQPNNTNVLNYYEITNMTEFTNYVVFDVNIIDTIFTSLLTDETLYMLALDLSVSSGVVTKEGTAADDQIAVWKTDGSIEGTSRFRYDDTLTRMYLGVDDIGAGSSLFMYGGSGTDGSSIQMYLGAGSDSSNQLFQISTYNKNWTFSDTQHGKLLNFNPTGSIWEMDQGDLQVGQHLNKIGIVTVFGNATTGGGFLLYNGADAAAENAYYQINADTDGKFVIQGGTTGAFLSYDPAAEALQIPDYGQGAKTGTAAYTLSVTAAGDIIETVVGGGDMVIATYDPAGIGEQLVGLTATQTLTNKTIDGNNNNITNIVGTGVFNVHNATGATLTKGTVVYPNGTSTLGVSNIDKAIANSHNTTEFQLGFVFEDILDGADGTVLIHGILKSFDTSLLSEGIVYLSPSTAGELTNTPPSFPDYRLIVGVVDKSDVSGELTIDINSSYTDTLDNFYNGTFRETFNFTVSSNGTVITGSLSPANGHPDMTMIFSDGFSTLDTTPPATIVLTEGTATVPQLNYVYIPVSTKVLTLSTSGFPTEEHIKIGYLLLQTAAIVQSDKALINQNFNDHVQDTTSNQGHLTHITNRLRLEGTVHISGTEGSSIVNNTPTPDSVSLVITGGKVSQLHVQDFDSFDTAVSGHAHVINHSVTPYKEISDLHDLVTDGEVISNTSFKIVVWGVVNSSAEPSKLFINLPSNSYAFASPEDAVNDPFNYTNYSIPSAFKTTGFLIAEITYTYKNNDWVVYNTKSLTGETPISAGGGGSGITTFLGLTDTPSSYSGQALKLQRVNAGETAIEFVGDDVIDHGSIGGLGDDDHTQYHNDARALTWLGTRSTSDLSEGTNLYYTEVRVAANSAVALNTAKDTNVVQTSIVGISGTKAQFDTELSDGNFMFIGDAPTSHAHVIADITDITGTPDGSKFLRDDGIWTTISGSIIRRSANGNEVVYKPSADTNAARGIILAQAIGDYTNKDLIIVGTGVYDTRIIFTDNLIIHFLSGAKVIYTGTAGALMTNDGDEDFTVNITGEGVFQHSGASGNRQAINILDGTILNIEGKSLISDNSVCIRTGNSDLGGSIITAKFDLYDSSDGTIDNVDTTSIINVYGKYAVGRTNFVLENDGGIINCWIKKIEGLVNEPVVRASSGTINIYETHIIAPAGKDAIINSIGSADNMNLYDCKIYSTTNAVDNSSPFNGYYYDIFKNENVSSGDVIATSEFTAGESVVAGDWVYLKSDGKFWKTNADAEATASGLIAMSLDTISANNVGTFQTEGSWTTTGLTVGARYYLSTTLGAITTTQPSGTADIVRIVGYALSTTELIIKIDETYIEV